MPTLQIEAFHLVHILHILTFHTKTYKVQTRTC